MAKTKMFSILLMFILFPITIIQKAQAKEKPDSTITPCKNYSQIICVEKDGIRYYGRFDHITIKVKSY